MYPDLVAVALAVYVPDGACLPILYEKVTCPLELVVPVLWDVLPLASFTVNVTDAPLTGVELVTVTVICAVDLCEYVDLSVVTETDSVGVVCGVVVASFDADDVPTELIAFIV
jgi:hypothetical protein